LQFYTNTRGINRHVGKQILSETKVRIRNITKATLKYDIDA